MFSPRAFEIGMSVAPLAAFFGVGLTIQVAEKLWPLRTYPREHLSPRTGKLVNAKKELALNVLAFVITYPILFLVLPRFEGPIRHALPHITGLGFLATVSRVVRTTVPWWLGVIVFFVLVDFGAYWTHRLMHTGAIWNVHAVHHSTERLHWFGGVRASPMHLFIGSFVGNMVVPAFWPISTIKAQIFAIFITVLMQNSNHANIRWKLGRLSWLLVTPRYHFVHHGAERRFNDSNFGFLLTIWDRMFGTFNDPDKLSNEFPLGLDYRLDTARMFVGLPPAGTTATASRSATVGSGE